MAGVNDRPLMMGDKRFANEVREGYDANLRYCFILGAGASFTSGIPLAKDLIEEWRAYLLQYSEKEMRRIAAYAGLDYDDKVAPLLADDYVPRSDDYFTFYDLRFAGMPVQAYAYFQSLMDKARPSFGYYALSVLLEDFENKLVVTTNFDSLVEETLSLTHAQRPLVVGHESLAPFLGSTENRTRPTVVKVHHDFLLRPMNGEYEVMGMDASLRRSLQKALSGYVPIVVGYAGADQSLMSLLEDMHFDAMYWCVMENSEADIDDKIKKLLRNMVTNGHLVHIKGFDEVMYLLFRRFVGNKSDKDYKRPNTRIRDYMQGRLKDYSEQLKVVAESLTSESEMGSATPSGTDDPEGSPDSGPATAPGLDAQPSDDEGIVPLDTLVWLSDDDQAGVDDDSTDKVAAKANLSYVRGVQEYREGHYEKALAEFEEAVQLDPDNVSYLLSQSKALRELDKLPESLEAIDRAAELKPRSDIVHSSRALTFRKMGLEDEALAEEEMVRKLLSNNVGSR